MIPYGGGRPSSSSSRTQYATTWRMWENRGPRGTRPVLSSTGMWWSPSITTASGPPRNPDPFRLEDLGLIRGRVDVDEASADVVPRAGRRRNPEGPEGAVQEDRGAHEPGEGQRLA